VIERNISFTIYIDARADFTKENFNVNHRLVNHEKTNEFYRIVLVGSLNDKIHTITLRKLVNHVTILMLRTGEHEHRTSSIDINRLFSVPSLT
jgi:hypothetical protein